MARGVSRCGCSESAPRPIRSLAVPHPMAIAAHSATTHAAVAPYAPVNSGSLRLGIGQIDIATA
jgi:hypothetical protein